MQLKQLLLKTPLSNNWIKEAQTKCQHSDKVVKHSTSDLFTIVSKKKGGTNAKP